MEIVIVFEVVKLIIGCSFVDFYFFFLDLYDIVKVCCCEKVYLLLFLNIIVLWKIVYGLVRFLC